MNPYLKVNVTDHVAGKSNAPVQLVEYADYQCPYCRKACYVIKEAQKELGENLEFIFRNFPLVELHPNALNAAFAAEAAGQQDKFWEMHDTLFENQEYLADRDLIAYAERIGMNVDQFKTDFGEDEYYQKIQKDYDSGIQCNVQGTPTFFINGVAYDGNWSTQEFIDYMRRLIR